MLAYFGAGGVTEQELSKVLGKWYALKKIGPIIFTLNAYILASFEGCWQGNKMKISVRPIEEKYSQY